jgi:hypothetical protein
VRAAAQGALKEWRARVRAQLQVPAVRAVEEFYGADKLAAFLAAAKPSMALMAGQELAVREVRGGGARGRLALRRGALVRSLRRQLPG